MKAVQRLPSACGAVAFSLFATFVAARNQSPRAPAPIVFFDIAGPASAKQAAFYATVFGWRADATGNFSIPLTGPKLNGTLRNDPVDKIIYIGVPDVAAALTAIVANGGRVVRPRFEVKGVVVVGLFTDPAGNSMGLVELAPDGRPKIP